MNDVSFRVRMAGLNFGNVLMILKTIYCHQYRLEYTYV